MSTKHYPLIQKQAETAGLILSQAMQEKILAYLKLLYHWGNKLNLTADPLPETIIKRHLPDVFQLALMVRKIKDIKIVADIGSGAGLPGALLSILCPHLQITLVEANRKKCSFLLTVKTQIDLALEVVNGRFEELKLDPVDMACSRATWAPEVWLQKAKTIIEPGKYLVVFSAGSAFQIAPNSDFEAVSRVNYTIEEDNPREILLLARE